MSVCWKSALTWSLLGLMLLLFALVFGPAPALAKEDGPDAVLYEVTEDMYLKDAAGNFVASVVPGGRRTAVAQLSGWAKLGTPLCPSWVRLLVPTAKRCAVNATGADDLSLATGKGTVGGTFRLPFSVSQAGQREKVSRGRDAFYLDDQGRLDRVKHDEQSLGVPTVKLEINF